MKFQAIKFFIKQNHLSMQNCNIYALNTIVRGNKVQKSPILSIITYLCYKQ